MKADLHPQYHAVEAVCVCGNIIQTGSTSKVIRMDICAACHPFFTGTQKIVDTEGRVEKFKKRFSGADDLKAQKAEEKKKAQEALAAQQAAEKIERDAAKAKKAEEDAKKAAEKAAIEAKKAAEEAERKANEPAPAPVAKAEPGEAPTIVDSALESSLAPSPVAEAPAAEEAKAEEPKPEEPAAEA